MNRAGAAALAFVVALAIAPAAVAAQPDDEPLQGQEAWPPEGDGHGPDDPEDLGRHDHPDVQPYAAVGGGGLSPFFNESDGCDVAAGVATPMSTTNSSPNRSLPSGHQVRGPWGDFFGRDYGDVSASMVSWTVPMSGGKVVPVHRRALAAFQQVTANLAAEQAKGNYYNARIVGSWSWRRIGGSYRMSTHAFGSTIDINWDTNPYSASNVLVTDMPSWYVKAWTDAGFCWGGDWQTIKDPMHFSWKGPIATPGYGDVPKPYAPSTAKGNYTQLAFSGVTAFGTLDEKASYFFADGNRDAAPDVFRLKKSGVDDLRVEYARSSRNFLACGVSEVVIRGARSGPGKTLLADYDGDARPDVWRVDTSGAKAKITVYTYNGQYKDGIEISTGAVPANGASYGAADYDRDGKPDFYVVERKGDTRVRIYSGASGFTKKIVDRATALPGTASKDRWRFSLADHDFDGIPDLVAIRLDGDVRLRIVPGAGGYSGAVRHETTGASLDLDGEYGLGDYDGDGRFDVLSMTRNGQLRIHLGGVQTGDDDFWFQSPGWSCAGTGSSVPWDLDGDRIADLVVGVPYDDVSGVVNAGVVNLLYGTSSGPSSSDDELWHQDSPGVESIAEANDEFGSSFAWGDYDGNGIGDLAVGAPRDGVGAIKGAGLVNVLYGGGGGLSGTGTMLHQDVSGVYGTAQVNDRFGSSLAAGDFNGDGHDDLAVGAPRDLSGAGVVNVFYGSTAGLTANGDQLWYQNLDGVKGKSNRGDDFGAALATGDFDRDGFDDLVIGAPGDRVSGTRDAGLIIVLYGSSSGLTAAGSERFSQKNGRIADRVDRDDRFGAALAAGDFDGDGFDDVAVGAPGELVSGREGAGQVHILFGRRKGLRARGNEVWNQDTPGVPGRAQAGDAFGSALAAGDSNGDGFADLAAGAWSEGVGGISNAGSVTTMFGKAAGLTGAGAVAWRQGKDGLTATSEQGDRFGAAVRFADLNGDGYDDLIAAFPKEDLNVVDAGGVMVIYAGPQGLRPSGAQVWHQDAGGVEGIANAGDRFGSL